jgi:hypothetical protein
VALALALVRSLATAPRPEASLVILRSLHGSVLDLLELGARSGYVYDALRDGVAALEERAPVVVEPVPEPKPTTEPDTEPVEPTD